MIKFFASIIIIWISIVTSFAQTTPEVKNVDFTVVNDTMFIFYDIANIKEQERFTVSVCIKTINGKIINPQTLTGDIGKNIKGGKDKKIVWDITKDNVSIDEEGYVEITAKFVFEQPPVVNKSVIDKVPIAKNPVIEKDSVANKPVIDKVPVANKSHIGTGKAILFSTLLPGLGNTKLSEGKPYWLFGIASYSCLAGGVIMSLSSSSAIKNYNAETTENDRDKSFSKSKSTGQTATYLFIGAGVLWVGDLIITAVQGGKSNKATSMNKRITIGYNYDTAMKQPLMMIKYKF